MHLRLLLILATVFPVVTGISQIPELSVTTGHFSPIISSRFSNNGALLATLDRGGNILIWDLHTGRQLKKLDGTSVKQLCFSSGDSVLYAATDSVLIQFDLSEPGQIQRRSFFSYEKEKIQGRCFSLYTKNDLLIAIFGNDVFCITPGVSYRKFSLGDALIVGKPVNMEINEKIPKGLLQQAQLPTHTGEEVYEVILSPDKTMLARVVRRKSGKKKGGFRQQLEIFRLSADFSSVEILQTLDYPDWNTTHKDLSFSPDNRLIIIMGTQGEIHVSQITANGLYSKPVRIIYPAVNTEGGKMPVNASFASGYFVTNERIYTSYNCDIITMNFAGKKIDFLPRLPERVTHFSISPDAKTLFCTNLAHELYLFDLQSGSLIRKIKTPKIWGTSFLFSDDGKTIFIGYTGGVVKRWDLTSNEIQVVNVRPAKSKQATVNSIEFIKDIQRIERDSILHFTYVSCVNGKAEELSCEWNYRSGIIRSFIISRMGTSEYLDYLETTIDARLKANPDVVQLNHSSFRLKNDTVYGLRGEKITDIRKIGKTDYYAVLDLSGKLFLRKSGIKENLLQLGILGNEGFYYFLPENNNYFASKEALQRLSFRIGKRIYSVDQFDMLYNRPDVVMSVFPFTDSSSIALYKKVYEKRMKREGKKSTHSGNDVPEVRIVGDIPFETGEEKISIPIRVSGKNTAIEEIHCYSNGVEVAVFSSINKHEYTVTIPITLTSGINLISIEATNANGVRSLREELEIKCRSKITGNTYVVCIGSGEFETSGFNLRYAAKDAQDISSYFNSRPNTTCLTICGKDVTNTVPRRIADFIAPAKANDKLLVFYSGHGLLDEQFNYFLSTYQVNFNNPALNGLRYDSLITVLERSPCRQKALFLDACHSGEVEKDVSVLTTTTEKTGDDVIVFRGSSSELQYGGDLNSRKAFELSRILFADVELSGGVSVLSSAGGLEFALEGEKWKNGVFTYALLVGLKEKKADYNGDGSIVLSELQAFLSETVSRLTGGRQTPSRRTENLRNDFVIR